MRHVLNPSTATGTWGNAKASSGRSTLGAPSGVGAGNFLTRKGERKSVNQANRANRAVGHRSGLAGHDDGRVSKPELVHTSEAAKVLGLSARSIARWVAEKKITPDLVTPGGHMRWNIEGLCRQLHDLQERND